MVKYIKYLKWKKAIEESGLFDVKYYLFTYPDIRAKHIDPIRHYLRIGADEGRNPNAEFDTKFYLEAYPDVKDIGINPLAHYILYGRTEGRLPCENIRSKQSLSTNHQSIDKKRNILNNLINKTEILIRNEKKGLKEYDKGKETVILVSHESSATGAPLLGLNIGKVLSEKYNLIHYVMKEANIHVEFEKDCFLIVSNISNLTQDIFSKYKSKYDIKCVLCNSVVTFPVLAVAYTCKLPTISLIHEFAEYTKPESRMLESLLFANKVVLPANIIKNSILEQLQEEFSISKEPNNIEILPQGKLIYLPETYGKNDSKESLYKKFNISDDSKDNTKIIVASGYAQIRKGVDLFIYTANYIKKNYNGECKFVWVGDGFNPKSDVAYSLWLEREIKHLGLSKDFIFLEHQKNLDTIFAIADIFCLTSRMDPFPNVVIDALEADLPIACFKDASGSVEFLETNNAYCIIADYLDTCQLGNLIATELQQGKSKKGINQIIVKEKLSFYSYMNQIFKYIKDVEKEQNKIINTVNNIQNSGLFDNKFYDVYENLEESILHYANVTKKNIIHANPRVGFNDMLWREEHGDSENPLLDAINKNISQTHNCLRMPTDTQKEEPTFKYAVHLHLYYTDLTNEFAQYFKSFSGNFDILITVVDGDKNEQIKQVFEHHTSAKNIKIKIVENIGRDIGPMIFEFKDELISGGYEVIGHFHSKRSLSTDNDMGDRWRKYLLDNLVGDNKTSNDVLNLFENKKVGLIFAEDRHYVDIGKNGRFVNSLAKMMDISKIKETYIFPIGNMFWARTDAIKDMFYLDKDEILQQEPLPYDGSYMHALERITPILVEKNSYEYITVYKEGTNW